MRAARVLTYGSGHHGIAGLGESVAAKVDCRDKAGKEVEPRSLCAVTKPLWVLT